MPLILLNLMYNSGMTKATFLQTIAIFVSVFMMGWAIRSEIAANTAKIAELRSVLLAHINGHSHVAKTIDESEEGVQ